MDNMSRDSSKDSSQASKASGKLRESRSKHKATAPKTAQNRSPWDNLESRIREWDDSSIAFEQMTRGYTSRKAQNVSSAKKIKQALHDEHYSKGTVGNADEEDYRPVSPLRRKKPQIEDHEMLLAFTSKRRSDSEEGSEDDEVRTDA